MPFEPKFPECVECKWFRKARCLPCGAGEFFEEADRDDDPDEADLFGMLERTQDDE